MTCSNAGFTALKIDLDIHAYGHAQSEVAGFTKDRFNHTAGAWEHDRMVSLAEMVKTAAGDRRSTSPATCTRGSTCRAPSASPATSNRLNLMWLEEPVPPENVDAMREIKRGDHPRRSAPARTSISATASAS